MDSHRAPIGKKMGTGISVVVAFALAGISLSYLMWLLRHQGGRLGPSRLMRSRMPGVDGNFSQIWLPLEKINPYLVELVVAQTDPDFFRHCGIDFRRIARAWRVNRQLGRPALGGSSITAQVAKNLFLWTGKDYFRKALEVPLSLGMEWIWGKRRILEVYLNIAEWGNGVFGIEAASQVHFGVSNRDLTAKQCALLAVVLPNPRIWSPARPSLSIMLLAERLRRIALKIRDHVG